MYNAPVTTTIVCVKLNTLESEQSVICYQYVIINLSRHNKGIYL